MGSRVWSGWPEAAYRHDTYQRRLAAVQDHLAQALDRAPVGPVRIVSVCAGDGRDVIEVLQSHPRRKDVCASLVEVNRKSVASGVRHADSAGLQNTVNFLNEDATLFATYRHIAPADIVLVCGVWGHVPAHQRLSMARGLACLCKPGGSIIWTRGVSQGHDRLREIQLAFGDPPWQQVRIDITSDRAWAVATYRYLGAPTDLPSSGQMFHFERLTG
jgi:hypothetical protein